MVTSSSASQNPAKTGVAAPIHLFKLAVFNVSPHLVKACGGTDCLSPVAHAASATATTPVRRAPNASGSAVAAFVGAGCTTIGCVALLVTSAAKAESGKAARVSRINGTLIFIIIGAGLNRKKS